MSTSISGEIGSTVMTTIYDELNTATKKIIKDLEDPCLESAIERLNALKEALQQDKKSLGKYNFKLFIFELSSEIKTLFEAREGGLLSLAHAASARHPLLSPQVEAPKTESARQASSIDSQYIDELKKEDALQALIRHLSVVGARTFSSESNKNTVESISQGTSSTSPAPASNSNKKPLGIKIDINQAKRNVQIVDENFAIKIK